MSIKLTQEIISKRTQEVSNNTLEYIPVSSYKNKNQKANFKHSVCGLIFTRSIDSIINGNKTSCPHCEPSKFTRDFDALSLKLLKHNYKLIQVINNSGDRGTSKIEFISCCCTVTRHNSNLLTGKVKCQTHNKTIKSSAYTEETVNVLLKSFQYGSFTLITPFQTLTKKATIKCDKCLGTFEQSIDLLRKAKGKCKICFGSAKSIQEEYIAILLSDLNLKFVRQFKVESYFFDFYLPSYNILIEYDGEFHETGKWFSKPVETCNNDLIKNKLANDLKYKLYRISHTDNILKSILNIYEDVQRLER